MIWLALLYLAQVCSSSRDDRLPVVLWHGLGDNYENAGLTDLAASITKQLGVETHLIHFGDSGKEDQRATFFGKAAQYVERAHDQIVNNPALSGGYDAVGFSQGGQFLRALAQGYREPRMRTLITLGSQHMGISEMAACRPNDWLCRSAEWALKAGVWSGSAQGNLIPAQYFRNQASIAAYLKNSGWLRELNNERWGDKQIGGSEDYMDESDGEGSDQSPRNDTLKANLLSLHHFYLFSFSKEATVIPHTSANFGLLNYSTTPPSLIPLHDLPIYKEDYIGLRQLDERGSLHLDKSCNGVHMEIDEECWANVLEALKEGASLATPKLIMQQ